MFLPINRSACSRALLRLPMHTHAFMVTFVKPPEPGRKGDLFRPAGIGVDRGRRHRCMTEPLLHEIERHAGLQRPYTEGVTKPARRRASAVHAGVVRYSLDKAPSRLPAPWPK